MLKFVAMTHEYDSLIGQAFEQRDQAIALQRQALTSLGQFIAIQLQELGPEVTLRDLSKQVAAIPGMSENALSAARRALNALRRAQYQGVPQTLGELSVANQSEIQMKCRGLGNYGMYLVSPIIWRREWVGQ